MKKTLAILAATFVLIGSAAEALSAGNVAADNPPMLIRRVNPVYPEEALRAGLEGAVWLKILVGVDGKPQQVEIQKSTSEIFNQSAVNAARRFLFTPAFAKDKLVTYWLIVPFNYELADKTGEQDKERKK
jgi:TonB family protein